MYICASFASPYRFFRLVHVLPVSRLETGRQKHTHNHNQDTEAVSSSASSSSSQHCQPLFPQIASASASASSSHSDTNTNTNTTNTNSTNSTNTLIPVVNMDDTILTTSTAPPVPVLASGAVWVDFKNREKLLSLLQVLKSDYKVSTRVNACCGHKDMYMYRIMSCYMLRIGINASERVYMLRLSRHF